MEINGKNKCFTMLKDQKNFKDCTTVWLKNAEKLSIAGSAGLFQRDGCSK